MSVFCTPCGDQIEGAYVLVLARQYLDRARVIDMARCTQNVLDFIQGAQRPSLCSPQVLIVDLVRDVLEEPVKDPMVFRQMLALDARVGARLLEVMALSRLAYVQRYGEALLEFGTQVSYAQGW